ncbi:hypothetical protein [Sphingomonas sp. RS2018]
MTPLLDERTSHMTEIADRTLAATFRRMSPEEALYRDCPSAFWLAPGGDDALPTMAEPTMSPRQTSRTVARPRRDLARIVDVASQRLAIAAATVAAGPIFAAMLMLTLPSSDSLLQGLGKIVMLSIVGLPLTVIVGSFLGVLPICGGAAFLCRLGRTKERARTCQVWAATGAGMGLAIAGLLDAGLVSIPLILTSVACALIAHGHLDWIEAEPALLLPHDDGMACA